MKQFALRIRKGIIDAIGSKGGGHIGGSLDLAELASVLYSDIMKVNCNQPEWDGRDYLVSSKGHAGPVWYATLAIKGFFPYERLLTLNQEGTLLPGHCDRDKVPGIDATTGSLGQGISIACGIAKGIKLKKSNQYVFCIIGDGESAEGQVWEAAEFASHYKLDNLITFLDWNNMQIDGTNDEVMTLGDPVKKFSAFGWHSQLVDGADVIEIRNAILNRMKAKDGKPSMIVLKTKKGSNLNCILSLSNNHCIGVPNDLYQKCLEELNEQAKELGVEL